MELTSNENDAMESDSETDVPQWPLWKRVKTVPQKC